MGLALCVRAPGSWTGLPEKSVYGEVLCCRYYILEQKENDVLLNYVSIHHVKRCV